MPRPKTLDEHVADQTWRARLPNHRELLDTSPPPTSQRLAALQARYRAAENEFERRHLAREFGKAMREPDPDEQAALDAEVAEFEAIVYGPPEEVDDDEIGRGLDRSYRTLLARDLRSGVTYGRPLTYAEIGEKLGVSASTARRLVNPGQVEAPR